MQGGKECERESRQKQLVISEVCGILDLPQQLRGERENS